MDVRCEKCQTEYELDDARVRAAGATVKCTQCGYLFRVLPNGRAMSEDGMPSSSGDGVDWMIRDAAGKVQSFRELTTLQQWIVERKVTRDCSISKRGEKWKRLGEIAELASFFQVVDRAQAAVRSVSKGRSTQPFAPIVIISPRGSSPSSPGVAHAPTMPAMVGPHTPGPHRGSFQAPTPSEPAWTANRESAFRAPSQPSGPVSTPPHAGGGQPAARAPRATPGSSSGFAPPPKAQPSHTRGPTFDSEPQMSPYDPETFQDDDDDLYVYRSKAPWIVLGLLLLAGAGAGMYLVFFWNQSSTPVALVVPDAAVTFTQDDVPVRTQPPAPEPELLPFAQAIEEFDRDTEAGYAAAEKLLQTARSEVPAEDARVLAAMARVNSAWVQALHDKAALVEPSDKRKAEQFLAEAKRKYVRAKKFVADAQKRSAKTSAVLLALADVKRVGKANRRIVERLLKPVQDHPDKNYITAMVWVGDGRADLAKEMLSHVITDHRDATGREHVRAQFQLALLLFKDDDVAGAKAAVEKILAAQPGHERARLVAQAMSAQVAASGDTVPPAVADPDATDVTDSAAAVTSYAELIKKGNSLSERGRCTDAMKLFEKAQDQRDDGVEALTGMGYCHLDASNYHSAQANFRAALVASPFYGDAMIGIAEVYRYQKNNDKAYAAYMQYLEAHPSGPKASIAKRNADRLKPAGTPESPDPTPPEPTRPDPEPTPTEPTPNPETNFTPTPTPTPEPPSEAPAEKKPDPPAPAPDPAPSEGEATASE